MKPYKYTKDNNSVIINCTNLPKDWCNYLWSEQGYIGRFTQAGHGESYAIDDKANLCELNSNESRYIYLRDNNSGSCWNIGEAPLMEPVNEFECEHNVAFTKISSKKNDIRGSVRYFIPNTGYYEVWTVTLKNEGAKSIDLSMFSVVDFRLEGFKYPRYHEMERTLNATYNKHLNGIYCKSAHHYAPHSRYNGFLASSEPIFASDAHLKPFTGGTGSFARPKMLLSGGNCTNTDRACYNIGGVLQNNILLAPGEKKEIHLIYGMAESENEAITVCEKMFAGDTISKVLTETIKIVENKYNNLTCEIPNERFNQLMNKWVQKQVDFCMVGKKGVRDNAQITSAILMYNPQRAKNEILEILRHQYKSGNAVLTWLPLDEERYSDQPFWIIFSISELLKETGDFSVFDEVIEYQDGGEGTVLEHLKAAVNRLLDDRGKNGLVKIFHADWNDSLNIKDDPEAESVMLSLQFCLALQEMVKISQTLGDTAYAQKLQADYEEVKKAINASAWDGDYYARALSDKGNVGVKSSEGSKIYLNPQVWSLLSDVCEENNIEKVLAAIDGMEHDFGFPINTPPYENYSDHFGRMSLMAPGLYENGGVYCHASAFKVMMDGKMGRGEEAVRTLSKLTPDSKYNPYTLSETEPYVFTNCYAIHPNAYGKADRSWITGTSAWCMKGLYEGILGIYKDYDGLRIAPAFPPDWNSAKATRVFRGGKYIIEYKRTSGEKYIEMNNQRIAGNILPTIKPGETARVVIFF
ncbi:MAG: cellobiose phosphorylase [Bacteroidetes bacterium]|jgi:cellobiose phosphorylase|nr:cellobiose phosphorylase [Bacteroidota bacterium]